MIRQQSGFTIIETTLVLAITGLLAASVLAGISTSISQERYTDSVDQTLDFFRGQYTQIANIVNDRSSKISCDSNGIVNTQGTAQSSQVVGASGCLLLGHILRSEDNGQSIVVTPVVALKDVSKDSSLAESTDEEALQHSSLAEVTNDSTQYTMEWGSSLLAPGTTSPTQFSIMIVRAPVSGVVRTYADASSATTSAVTLIGSRTGVRMCIDRGISIGTALSPMGIDIAKDAANTTSVQLIAAGSCTS